MHAQNRCNSKKLKEAGGEGGGCREGKRENVVVYQQLVQCLCFPLIVVANAGVRFHPARAGWTWVGMGGSELAWDWNRRGWGGAGVGGQ